MYKSYWISCLMLTWSRLKVIICWWYLGVQSIIFRVLLLHNQCIYCTHYNPDKRKGLIVIWSWHNLTVLKSGGTSRYSHDLGEWICEISNCIPFNQSCNTSKMQLNVSRIQLFIFLVHYWTNRKKYLGTKNKVRYLPTPCSCDILPHTKCH